MMARLRTVSTLTTSSLLHVFSIVVVSCGVYCFGALVSFLSGHPLFEVVDDLKVLRRWMAVMLSKNTFVVAEGEFNVFKASILNASISLIFSEGCEVGRMEQVWGNSWIF